MNYLKRKHMVCLEKIELENLFRAGLDERLSRKGYTFDNSENNIQKMHKIAKAAKIKDKNEIEMFIALFGLLKFYPKESQICFVLKDNINPQKDIKSLVDLKKAIKESDLTDFGILFNKQLSEFQLKRYVEKELNIDTFSEFIKKKISHYGNNLGSTNLLILLSGGGYIDNDMFRKLNEKLKSYNFKFRAEILIYYNEENKSEVIYQVFPDLKFASVPFKLPSNQ